MGGAMSSLFSSPPSYETPKIPGQPTREDAKDPVAKSTREAERRRVQSRKTLSGTILSSNGGNNLLS